MKPTHSRDAWCKASSGAAHGAHGWTKCVSFTHPVNSLYDRDISAVKDR